MSEDLKSELNEKEEGELSDSDLNKVTGGKDDEVESTPAVTYKYTVGQQFYQNVSPTTADSIKILSAYAIGDSPYYQVVVAIYEANVTNKSGYTDVSEADIDKILEGKDSNYTIEKLAEKVFTN